MSDAVYVVNTPEDARAAVNRPFVDAKVLVVDATKITLEELGQNRPNAPLLRSAFTLVHRRLGRNICRSLPEK